MERKIENEQLLKILDLFKKLNCETIEEARSMVIKKKMFFEQKDFVIDFLNTNDKTDFLITNLLVSIKNEPFFPYEKIEKICYSAKNQDVKFILSDNKSINKKASDVTFDLINIKGVDFFKYVN